MGKIRRIVALVSAFVGICAISCAQVAPIPSDFTDVNEELRTWFAAAAVGLIAVLITLKLIKLVPRAVGWFMRG